MKSENMTVSEREQVKLLAECLFEMISQMGSEWDQAYCWFSSPNRDRGSSQCTFKHKESIEFIYFEGVNKYSSAMQKQMFALVDGIEESNNSRPLATLIEIQRSGDYKMFFDYDNPIALDVSPVKVGTENSYFRNV
ncbi:hypothetical protein FLL45_04360 [Aliikangiella marina]|uniref:DUF600 family protein n=1 Tax=Aliikangiella marina TaxID=1712262 RepID=A0A545TJ41_9GAMM|nr:hypothetical protein [Aliikangiella marina]TQV77186.1 hypothetical protein FLL45_04360 [Aliikangiella marina]